MLSDPPSYRSSIAPGPDLVAGASRLQVCAEQLFSEQRQLRAAVVSPMTSGAMATALAAVGDDLSREIAAFDADLTGRARALRCSLSVLFGVRS